MSPRRRSGPDKRGGLNGSTQHLLEVYLQQFQKPKSFASIDSNATPPCLGLMQYSQTDRFSRRSIVGSTDLIVLHRPVELTLFIRWDEKAGLRRDAIRSQRLTRSRRDGKETGYDED